MSFARRETISGEIVSAAPFTRSASPLSFSKMRRYFGLGSLVGIGAREKRMSFPRGSVKCGHRREGDFMRRGKAGGSQAELFQGGMATWRLVFPIRCLTAATRVRLIRAFSPPQLDAAPNQSMKLRIFSLTLWG